ncbi:hypothetical protein JXA47_08385 [Candidatus Sumerlaeota bacterium]|nr:hypothetical protein [Candidatus Sumerlaeota bacterium]
MRPLLTTLLFAALAAPGSAQTVISTGPPVDLEQIVFYQTAPGGTPLSVMMSNLSDLTGVSIHLVSGGTLRVRARFDGVPLRQIFEEVCRANGLQWEAQGSVILIRQVMQTRSIVIAREDIPAVAQLFESGVVDQLIRGPNPAPPGQAIVFDDVLGVVAITAPPDVQDQVLTLLNHAHEMTDHSQGLETRMYSVSPGDSERLAVLLEAQLLAEGADQAPHAAQRRIIAEGDNLVVRDTRANLARVEELLQDERLVEGLAGGDLDARVYSLVPRGAAQSPEQARQFANQVVETVETLLYSEGGREAAREEGRRLWFDEPTLQLTITDHPDNLETVDRYIAQIVTGESRRTLVEIPLEGGRSPSEIVQMLGDLVDVRIAGRDARLMQQTSGGFESPGPVGEGGTVVTRWLDEGDELSWRGLRVTLADVRMTSDEPEAVFVVDTYANSEERSIRRLRSAFFGDYRVRVLEISHGGGVRVEITELGQEAQTILR